MTPDRLKDIKKRFETKIVATPEQVNVQQQRTQQGPIIHRQYTEEDFEYLLEECERLQSLVEEAKGLFKDFVAEKASTLNLMDLDEWLKKSHLTVEKASEK